MKTNTYTLTRACMHTYTHPKTHFMNTIYLSLIYGQNSRWNNLYDSRHFLFTLSSLNHTLPPLLHWKTCISQCFSYIVSMLSSTQWTFPPLGNILLCCPSADQILACMPSFSPISFLSANSPSSVFSKCWCCLGCSHAMQSPWLISFITLTITSILTTNKSVSLAHFSFPSSVPMFLTAYYLRYTIWSLSRYLTLIMSQINLLYSPLYELSSLTEFPVYCIPSSFTPSPKPETWVLFQLPLSSWPRLLYIGFSCSIIWIRTATLFWDMTSPPSTSGLDSPSFTV